jgi:hypothetical protein
MNKEKLFCYLNIALSTKSIHESCQIEIGEFTYKVTLFSFHSKHTHTTRRNCLTKNLKIRIEMKNKRRKKLKRKMVDLILFNFI